MDIVGDTTEVGTATLNASGTGGSSYTSILIRPSGDVARTITGALALPLIDLNGADAVTIDGLNYRRQLADHSSNTDTGAASETSRQSDSSGARQAT